MSRKVTHYNGDKVDVSWDGRLCIHIAECGKAQGDLFVSGREPWCQPDLVSTDEVVDVVQRCPSGALSYRFKEQPITEMAPAENTLQVAYNGPYFLRGDLSIEGTHDDMPGIQFRAALCRCGASKNKPFCDNCHEGIPFRDSGAVGEKGEALESKGGKLEVNPLPDGPLLLTGNLTIRNGSGEQAWSGNNVALCRCGASNNKPFCEGSHKGIGFKSDE